MPAPKGHTFNIGRKHTEESKKNMSRAKKGKKLGPRGPNKKPFSIEARKNMSIAHMGEKNHFYGKQHTDETKEKISQKALGRPSSRKGQKCTKGTKIKMKQNHADVLGSNNPAWNGGRNRRSNGYIYVYAPNHPLSTGGQIAEHRLVMEETIGRHLIKGEEVHHKNGIRDDNRAENLELWTNSHPCGQRVEDKIKWAKEFLQQHGYNINK